MAGVGSLALFGREAMLRKFFLLEDPVPGPLQAALVRTVPEVSMVATDLDEPSALVQYARETVTLGADWTIDAERRAVYTPQILFSPPVGDWGLIVGWALVAGTEIISCGTFVNRRRVQPGVRGRIPASTIKVGLYD